MGRPARPEVLPRDAAFAAVWKLVNREKLMAYDSRKLLLVDCLEACYPFAQDRVQRYALCVLPDRYYLAASIEGNHDAYSDWVRQAHSQFALELNARIKHNGRKRVGPVGRDRPNTSAVENAEEFKKSVYAMHYAPVVSGLVEKPEDYAYSTHNLYAYGRTADWNESFAFPQWYMELGETMAERQKRYRKEAADYYRSGRLDCYLKDLHRNIPLGSPEHKRRLARYRALVIQSRCARLRRQRQVPEIPSPEEGLVFVYESAFGVPVRAVKGELGGTGPPGADP